MIFAIAANGNNLSALVNQNFGRCEWFCLFDTKTHKNLFIENPANQNPEKAGCDAVEILLGKNVGIAIAGRFGSKVADMFRRNNIQMVIPEIQQTVSEITNQIK